MASTFRIERAESEEDLKEILLLQKKNLKSSLEEDEKTKEGFLTVIHDLKILKVMNDLCQHFIARENKMNKIVGYALCTDPSLSKKIPQLKPLFKTMESLDLKETYIVMGQICIEKEYRGKGIFRALYNQMKSNLKTDYNLIITEVADSNKRSLNAHMATGFSIINKHNVLDEEWNIISLQCETF